MGVLDKIKNALFEVEYIEVEEPPKKEKKVKEKPKAKEEHKPIAKKIVLPGKKEDKVEEIEEEELLDEDFEIRPKEEAIIEEAKESFKLMDDDDFKVDDDVDYLTEEPEIIEEPKVEVKEEVKVEVNYPQEKAYSGNRESKPYGMDNSYNVPVHQYGTYERYEERTYFKPSPIISPIYGILDKNYKKEDVREKKDARNNAFSSVDEVRNKAYGRRTKDEEVPETKVEIDDEEDKLMVDLSDKAKPEVKEVTMGDALEYFQDLGLEYNVDYVDTSTEKKVNPKEEKKEEKVEADVKEESKTEETLVEEKEDTKEIEKIEETKEDDDNLFDLIDSMYQDNN